MSRSDIKLVESENMSQDPNGGGERTGVEIVDGKVGAVFPNTDTLDLVGGDTSIIKVYFGYDTNDNALFSGAHAYFTRPADSGIVNTTMMIAESRTEERADAVRRLESFTYISELDTSEKQVFQVESVGGLSVTPEGSGYGTLVLTSELTAGTEYVVIMNTKKPANHHLAKINSIQSEAIIITPPLPSFLVTSGHLEYLTVETANPSNIPVEIQEAIAGQNTIKTAGNLVNAEFIKITDAVGNYQSNKVVAGFSTDTLTVEHPISTRLQPPLVLQGLTFKKSPTQFYSAKAASSNFSIDDTVLPLDSVTQRIKPITKSFITESGLITIPSTTVGADVGSVVVGDKWQGLPTLREEVVVSETVRPFNFTPSAPIFDSATIAAWTSFQGESAYQSTLGSISEINIKPEEAINYFQLPVNLKQWGGNISTSESLVSIDDTLRVTTTATIDVVPQDNYRLESIPLDFATNGQLDGDGRTYLSAADAGVTIPLSGSESIPPGSVLWWVYDPLVAVWGQGAWSNSKSAWRYNTSLKKWQHYLYQEVVLFFDDGEGGIWRARAINELESEPKTGTSTTDGLNYKFNFCFDGGLSVSRDFATRDSNLSYDLSYRAPTKIANIDYSTGAITGEGAPGDPVWYQDEMLSNNIFVQTQSVGDFNIPGASDADRSYFALPLPPFNDYDRETLNLRFRKVSDNSLITGSSDAAGIITGAGITSGTVTSDYLVDVLFDEPVILDAEYDIEQVNVESLPFDNAGIEPFLVPVDGQIEVFNPFEYVVIHNTQEIDIATQTNGQAEDCGRPVDFVDVIDSTGAKLWTVNDDYYSVNKTTGIVTLNGDWVGAGFTAPFKLTHVVSETALVDSVDYENNTVSIDRPLLNNYPQAGTYVSNAMELGDLQASVKVLYDSEVWVNREWSDENKGVDTVNSFDDANHPITTTNEGCFDGLFVIEFTSASGFTVYHETLGNMGSGDVNSDTVITRAGKVVMTIPGAGFGGSWSSGNIIMLEGQSAFKGAWMIRLIDPTQQSELTYDVGLQIRGNFE